MGSEAARVLTLHYSVGEAEGAELVSTFGGRPATLALGGGELAPALERCLGDAEPGKRYVFLLEPGQAFGLRRDDLVRSLPRSAFPSDMEIGAGTVVEFSAPDGGRHAGVIRDIDAREVRVDFNHPLAGRPVRFEVEVLAVT